MTIDTCLFTPWWSISPDAGYRIFDRIQRFAGNGTVNAVYVPDANKGYSVDDGGSAKISISGVLLKNVPGWMRLVGIDATGYADIARHVEHAASDESVKEIHLLVNSPGGTVEGSADAADAIYNARGSKPIKAFIEGCGASGAYLLASQADAILAEKNAVVGSIGVYSYMYDYSEMASKNGIKPVVFASGRHKGTGVPGTEITKEQQLPLQAIVDGMADNFIESVARGRGVSVEQIEKIATGQSWIAKSAMGVGLVDGVVSSMQNENLNIGDSMMSEQEKQKESLEEIEALAKAADTDDEDDEKSEVDEEEEEEEKDDDKDEKSKKDDEDDEYEKDDDEDDKKSREDDDDKEKSMRRLSALRAAFPNNPSFVLDQFAAGADVTQAKAAYFDRQQSTDGAEPVASTTHNGTSGSDFMSLSRDMASSEKISITEAMKRIRARYPGLHESYVKKN